MNSNGQTPDQPPVEWEVEAADSARSSERKLLLLAAVVAVCIAIVYLTPLKRFAAEIQEGKVHIQNAGAWPPIVYFAASSALTAMGFPRLVLCGIAGMLFGFVEGGILALFSALIGAYGTFVFARWGGQAWVARRLEKRKKLSSFLQHPSIASVFLMRQLPIPGVVPNLLLGMTRTRHRVFLLGSFLGFLPLTMAAALIGSSVGKGSLVHSLEQIAAAILGLCAVSLVVRHLRKRSSYRSR